MPNWFGIGNSVRQIFKEKDQASNEKMWDWNLDAKVLKLRTRTDADGAGVDILTATRGTGTAMVDLALGLPLSGTVLTLSGQVALRWRKSATQAITGDVVTKLTFNTSVFDATSGWNSTDNKFTTLVAGYYNVAARAITTGVFTNDYRSSLYVYVNGALHTVLDDKPGRVYSTNPHSLGGMAPIYLAVNDYVEIYVYYQTTSMTVDAVADSTFVSIVRMF